jgi:hypothetical protein
MPCGVVLFTQLHDKVMLLPTVREFNGYFGYIR